MTNHDVIRNFHSKLFHKVSTPWLLTSPELKVLGQILSHMLNNSQKPIVATKATHDQLKEMSDTLLTWQESGEVSETVLLTYLGYVDTLIHELQTSDQLTHDGYSSNPKNPSCFKPYVGSEIIRACPITRGVYNDLRNFNHPMHEDPTDKGMLIIKDVNLSWVPLDVFEKAYRTNGNMTYGDALVLIKSGERVMRNGWNGKRLFVELVPSYTDAGHYVNGERCQIRHGAYTAITNLNTEERNPWVPSPTDHLAEDWAVFSEE